MVKYLCNIQKGTTILMLLFIGHEGTFQLEHASQAMCLTTQLNLHPLFKNNQSRKYSNRWWLQMC